MNILQKIENIKVCEMLTVPRPKSSGCDRFWTGDKKQYNLDYYQLNDSMTVLWLTSKLHNKFMVKKSMF